MNKVLVTGGNGQLARCLRDIASDFPEYHFIFRNKNELNITNKTQIVAFFEKEKPHFCINCAGYTAVDKAESEPERAKNINSDGVRYLAEACEKYKAKLIHISTDFVFDGSATTPYREDDKTHPLGVYGRTKLDGEQAIKAVLKEHFIIRTSWLYSEYGHNFLKTMIRLGGEKEVLQVVEDQMGAPTYAKDLANGILEITKKNTDKYGTYHFCNGGSTSWFGFAEKIVDLGALKSRLLPIITEEYPTQARRPVYSVLNTDKIKNTFDLEIPSWQDSLAKCIEKLNMR